MLSNQALYSRLFNEFSLAYKVRKTHPPQNVREVEQFGDCSTSTAGSSRTSFRKMPQCRIRGRNERLNSGGVKNVNVHPKG